MSAISLGPRALTTVQDLRDYLAAMEAAWTEEDTQFLGPFATQGVLTLQASGIAPATIAFGEHGLPDFVIAPPR